jgi:hypothetical protein
MVVVVVVAIDGHDNCNGAEAKQQAVPEFKSPKRGTCTNLIPSIYHPSVRLTISKISSSDSLPIPMSTRITTLLFYYIIFSSILFSLSSFKFGFLFNYVLGYLFYYTYYSFFASC